MRGVQSDAARFTMPGARLAEFRRAKPVSKRRPVQLSDYQGSTSRGSSIQPGGSTPSSIQRLWAVAMSSEKTRNPQDAATAQNGSVADGVANSSGRTKRPNSGDTCPTRHPRPVTRAVSGARRTCATGVRGTRTRPVGRRAPSRVPPGAGGLRGPLHSPSYSGPSGLWRR